MDSDQLYGLPLDQFVAERGALARELRTDGKRDQAAEVAALRKPSVAAWAVNQLVRTQRHAVDELFAAGDNLREVQAAVMDGRQDAQALRDAAGEERAAVDALITSARGLLTSGGHELSPTVLDRVADTLHATALDDDARAAVGDGRLERELRHVGLGAGGLSAPSPARRSGDKRRPLAKSARAGKTDVTVAKRGAEAKRGADAKRGPDAKRAERERADARRAARSAEADARREADRAARALKIAQERRERAAQALAEADEELASATSQAEAAVEAHRRARGELDSF